MSNAAELLSQAFQQHQAGHLGQAETLYRQVLQLEPRQPDALHLLGVLACQTGRPDEGTALLRQAVEVKPDHAEYRGNLGAALKELGRLDEAAACLGESLRLNPANAVVHYNLGSLLQLQGRLDEALRNFEKALEVRPDYAAAREQREAILRAQGRSSPAPVIAAPALDADALFQQAILLRRQGRLDEAAACYREVVRLRPDHLPAYLNLGNVLAALRRWPETVEWYRRIIALEPNVPEVHFNLGVALRDMGRVDEAAEVYANVLEIRPDFADAAINLCDARIAQGRIDETVALVRRTLRLCPDHPMLHVSLCSVLLRQGQPIEAAASAREALRLDPDIAIAHSALLYCLNFDPGTDPDALFEEHCRWGRRFPPANVSHPNDRDPRRRLRVGYVSPDLRRHALSRYLEPVLAHHDPGQVEVFCYANVAAPDDMTERLRRLAHHWRWIFNQPAQQVAAQVRADGIDLLIDLAGHTGGHRLDVFALEPAPVQATWLGYMNTTGLEAIDYRITDDVLDPPGAPVRDTERLLRLPGGSCCFAGPADAPEVSSLPALRSGRLTFGSLHPLTKINAAVLDLWRQVLHALPEARLLMFRDTLRGVAREALRRQLVERGIADERLDLREGTATAGYLKIYDEIDVSLDVLPYSGGTTTCESLWMGAPVLSLAGARPAGRGSAALLAIAGLHDWVVQTPEEYVALAVRTANNLDALASLRAGLRQRLKTALCDAPRFTRILEEAYRSMWRRWCAERGGPP